MCAIKPERYILVCITNLIERYIMTNLRMRSGQNPHLPEVFDPKIKNTYQTIERSMWNAHVNFIPIPNSLITHPMKKELCTIKPIELYKKRMRYEEVK